MFYENLLWTRRRCDSTLRGHFPLETDLISKSIDKLLASASARMSHVDVVAFIPAFFDGGRLTMNDIHYVVEGNNMVPAGMTPFAKDAHFGYKSSNLIEFVREKVHDVDNIVSISLDDIREGGPHKVAEILLGQSLSLQWTKELYFYVVKFRHSKRE